MRKFKTNARDNNQHKGVTLALSIGVQRINENYFSVRVDRIPYCIVNSRMIWNPAHTKKLNNVPAQIKERILSIISDFPKK